MGRSPERGRCPMPTSPFRDEGERLRAREAFAAVHSALFGRECTEGIEVRFDRTYPPIVDAPEGTGGVAAYEEMLRNVSRTSTPPDFDAALNDAVVTYASKMALVRNHPDRELFHERFHAARQRVRELHEAVVRERDDLKARLADLHRPTHGPCCTCQACGKPYDECRCDIDDLADELAKLRAAQQGEVYEVERITPRPMAPASADPCCVHVGPTYHPGDTVRVTRIEEAP